MNAQTVTGSIAAAVGLAACVTVNIYFPAPEVRLAAEEIVEETWGGAAGNHPTPTGGSDATHSSWHQFFLPARAQAQAADVDVSTPAIRALKDSMRARAAQLKPFLSAGQVGIGKDGLLVVRTLDGVPLGTQATIRRLVEAENRDRLSLYREIAKANKFGDERIPEIQQIFAETWIAKAESGWWIQQPDGKWGQR